MPSGHAPGGILTSGRDGKPTYIRIIALIADVVGPFVP